MAIDIRANVTCSLGELISASINDSYIQGGGLVFCRGTCEINGIITPAPGTSVTFSYTKAGVTRTIPRSLKVLASFADPFRGITKVGLGCPLTLRENRKETRFVLYPSDNPPPPGYVYEDPNYNPWKQPLTAQEVAATCLANIGITSSGLSLVSRFSVTEFDFSSGYVNVLSGLLASESKAGYVDANDVLRVFSLSVVGGTGPVLSTNNVIDVGPLSLGAPPGDRVVVSYKSLKYKGTPDTPIDLAPFLPIRPIVPPPPVLPDAPDFTYVQNSFGEVDEYTSTDIAIAYTDPVTGEPDIKPFSCGRYVNTNTNYTELQIDSPQDTEGDEVPPQRVTVVRSRTTYEGISAALAAGNLISQLLTAGYSVSNEQLIRRTLESFQYDSQGRETRYELWTEADGEFAIGSMGIPAVFEDGILDVDGRITMERIVRTTSYRSGFTRTVTYRYGPWLQSVEGQQAVAESGLALTSLSSAQLFYNEVADRTALLDTTVNLTYEPVQRSVQNQRGSGLELPSFYFPSSANSRDGNRTPGSAEATGDTGNQSGGTSSPFAAFVLPFPTDDWIEYDEEDAENYARLRRAERDAATQAQTFARVQINLINGNRSGMFVQTTPEVLPTAPFAPLVIQAGGISGLYRVNGMTWTLDANGIVCGVDALFWGGVGGSGIPFFPVAPGVTSLPSTPPIVDTSPTLVLGTIPTAGTDPQTTLDAAYPDAEDGHAVFAEDTEHFWRYDAATTTWVDVGTNPGPTMTVETVVPPYNERTSVTAATRTGLDVTAIPYALTVLRGPVAITTGPALVVTPVVPSLGVSLTALAPQVNTGTSLTPPSNALAIAALPPLVATGVVVAAPVAEVTVAAVAPDAAGRPRVTIPAPTTSIAVTTHAPAVAGGASVAVPAAGTTVAGLAPIEVGYNDPVAALNPILWYDFSDESTITLSGTTITQINGKGSRAWNLTKSSTGPTQATWTNNSLKCCDWGAAGHGNHLQTTDTTSTTMAEIYFVLDANYGSTFTNYNGLVSDTGSGGWYLDGSPGGAIFAPNVFTTAFINGSVTDVYSSAVLPAINSPSILRVGRSSGPFNTTNGFQIGNDRTFGYLGRGWGGLIAEVIAFSSALSESDRNTLQAHLADKWGITLV